MKTRLPRPATLLPLASIAGLLVFVAVEAVVGQPAPVPPPAAPPATQPGGGPGTRPAVKGPSARELLDSMLNRPKTPGTGPAVLEINPQQPEQPTIDASTGKAVAPNAPALPMVREGSYVVDRTGRLTRGADGASQEFTFETDGRVMRDPPMILLPNLKLTAMENAVSSGSRDVRFKVSGIVTEYHGRNCLLVEKVVVLQEQNQQF